MAQLRLAYVAQNTIQKSQSKSRFMSPRRLLSPLREKRYSPPLAEDYVQKSLLKITFSTYALHFYKQSNSRKFFFIESGFK